MKEENRIILIIFILIFLSMIIGFSISQIIEENTHDRYSDLLFISKSFANTKQYIINVYDCTEFSEDLVMIHRRFGYNTISVCGYVDKEWNYFIIQEDCTKGWSIINFGKYDTNTFHRWIYNIDYNIYIEATSGELIDKSKVSYANIYK